MGSAANPSPKLLAGEEGQKQLVAVQQEGERGLATYFESEKATAVLGENGLPPMPVTFGQKKQVKYEVGPASYEETYVAHCGPDMQNLLTTLTDILAEALSNSRCD